jgi:hypothetical protein
VQVGGAVEARRAQAAVDAATQAPVATATAAAIAVVAGCARSSSSSSGRADGAGQAGHRLEVPLVHVHAVLGRDARNQRLQRLSDEVSIGLRDALCERSQDIGLEIVGLCSSRWWGWCGLDFVRTSLGRRGWSGNRV